MKNIIKAVLAYAFLGYVLLTIFVNMSLAGALLVVIPCGVAAYFITKYHQQRKANA
jgi:hypothetical protein